MAGDVPPFFYLKSIMSNWKNSFILYKDLEPTIAKLSDEEAGKLFKHLLQYVNDKDPILDDRLLELVFEPIKQSLKRDLEKWDWIRNKRSEAGKLWGIAKLANASKWKQKLANVAVSVSDSVSVSVSDSVSVIKKEKKTAFSPPTLQEVKDYFTSKWYLEDCAERAFDYYDVAWWVDSKGNKVRNWKQKMNSVWFKEENKIKELTMDQRLALYEKMWHVPFRIKYWSEKATEVKLYSL